MKLYRIIFPVNDINKAAEFYSEVFKQAGERVSPGRHYFDLEGTILAVYDPIADGDEISTKWAFHENQYIYIAVDDLESVHERIECSKGANIETGIEKMPWGERLFYARDPFNNPICFVDRKTVFVGNN